MAVAKPCPRCGRLILYGTSYCPTCKPIAEAEQAEAKEYRAEQQRRKYNARYNARRDPKYMQFYRSKAWKNTSRAKLGAANWVCQGKLPGCQSVACEVHHVIPIQTPEGWDKRLEWENLEALCTSCHNGRHPEKFKRKQDDGVIDMKTLER